MLAVWHIAGARRTRATKNEFEPVDRDLTEGRQFLEVQLETKVFRIEAYRPLHVLHLVPNTPKARVFRKTLLSQGAAHPMPLSKSWINSRAVPLLRQRVAEGRVTDL